VWKTYNGGLVEIIQKLTEESVSGESDRGEMTAVDQRISNLSHVVLGGLECQETWRFKRMPENLAAGNQWPEKGNHPADDAAHGLDAYLVRGRQIDVPKETLIRFTQAALGNKHKRGGS